MVRDKLRFGDPVEVSLLKHAEGCTSEWWRPATVIGFDPLSVVFEDGEREKLALHRAISVRRRDLSPVKRENHRLRFRFNLLLAEAERVAGLGDFAELRAAIALSQEGDEDAD